MIALHLLFFSYRKPIRIRVALHKALACSGVVSRSNRSEMARSTPGTSSIATFDTGASGRTVSPQARISCTGCSQTLTTSYRKVS